jgi:hypothetical protein
MKIRLVWAELLRADRRTDGRTDRQTRRSSFHNFVNMHKIYVSEATQLIWIISAFVL